MTNADRAIAKDAATCWADVHAHLCSRSGQYPGQTADDLIASRGVKFPSERWRLIVAETMWLGKLIRGDEFPMQIAR